MKTKTKADATGSAEVSYKWFERVNDRQIFDDRQGRSRRHAGACLGACCVVLHCKAQEQADEGDLSEEVSVGSSERRRAA